jgi:hypothetical protein
MNPIIAPKPVLVDGPKVGDILVGIWGYNARLAVWARVVKVNAKTVTLVELEDVRTYDSNKGGMFWVSVPGNPNGEEKTKLIKVLTDRTGGITYCVKWEYCRLHPWGGNSIECYDVN